MENLHVILICHFLLSLLEGQEWQRLANILNEKHVYATFL